MKKLLTVTGGVLLAAAIVYPLSFPFAIIAAMPPLTRVIVNSSPPPAMQKRADLINRIYRPCYVLGYKFDPYNEYINFVVERHTNAEMRRLERDEAQEAPRAGNEN